MYVFGCLYVFMYVCSLVARRRCYTQHVECSLYRCSDRNDPCARAVLARPPWDKLDLLAIVIYQDSHWRCAPVRMVQHSVGQCELWKHQNQADFVCEQLMNYYWHDLSPLCSLLYNTRRYDYDTILFCVQFTTSSCILNLYNSILKFLFVGCCVFFRVCSLRF